MRASLFFSVIGDCSLAVLHQIKGYIAIIASLIHRYGIGKIKIKGAFPAKPHHEEVVVVV